MKNFNPFMVFMLLVFSLAPVTKNSEALTSQNQVETKLSEIQLITENNDVGAANEIFVGLQITLQPGWKTYWRSPGITGYPPKLDWSQSKNIDSFKIFWPKPHRFQVRGIEAIGYPEKVVLPIKITLKDPKEPVHVGLQV